MRLMLLAIKFVLAVCVALPTGVMADEGAMERDSLAVAEPVSSENHTTADQSSDPQNEAIEQSNDGSESGADKEVENPANGEGELVQSTVETASDEIVYDKGDDLDENPCIDLNSDEIRIIDATRRRLHQTLCGASLWFDGLFGENRNVDAAKGAHGRVETSYTYSDFYGNKARVRLNVRVNLPNLEDRASAFFGRDNDDDFVRDRQEGFALRSQFPSIDDKDQWMGGLGYSLPSNERFSSDIKVGVRNLRMPRAFVQSRIRYNAYSDKKSLIHLRLTPFWSTRDRFGVTPGADFSRVLSPTRLLRFSNAGTISQRSEGLDWRSALIHYQGLRKGRGIAVQAFIRGGTSAPVSISEYGSRAVYRHPLFHDRLYAELVGGFSWPQELREEDRRGSGLLAFGLELPFGKSGLDADLTPIRQIDHITPSDTPDHGTPISDVPGEPLDPDPSLSEQ